jgi:hypothetical protein
MTTAYHAVNMSNITDMNGYLGIANTVTNGAFWTSMCYMIFAVMLVSLAAVFGWEAAFLVSCFIGLIISILLVYLGLMNIISAGFFVGGLIIIIIYIVWRNPYD